MIAPTGDYDDDRGSYDAGDSGDVDDDGNEDYQETPKT